MNQARGKEKPRKRIRSIGMKKLAAVITALTLAALMGCDNSVSDPDPVSGTTSDATSGLRFQAAIDGAQERAAGTKWTPGDVIGISMLERGGAEVVDYASNRKYVSDTGNGVFAPASGMEKISVNQPVDFLAYYPYAANMNGFMYPVDVSSQTNQEALDLMTAERVPADQSAKSVALSFKHRLSAVALIIKAGENLEERELAGLQAAITGQAVRGEYDVNANALVPSTEEAAQSIAFKMSDDGKSGSAVILPAAGGSGRTVKLTMKTGNAMKLTFTKRIPDSYGFEPGVRYRFPITLYRPSPSASVDEIKAEGGFEGIGIQDWEDVQAEPDTGSPEGPNSGNQGTSAAGKGMTWKLVTDSPFIYSDGSRDSINAVAYGGGRFVAAGYNGRMAYSVDGISWTEITNHPFSGIKTIAYGDGKFVANDGNVWGSGMAYSGDGITWTELPDSPSCNTIVYGGGKFVTGYSYSEDGISWTEVPDSPIRSAIIAAIAYGDGKFLAGSGIMGHSGAYYSVDGISWTEITNSPFTGGINAIAYGDGKFVASGWEYLETLLNGTTLYGRKAAYSRDGITWTELPDRLVSNSSVIAYGGGKFVDGSLNSSVDGLTWTPSNKPDGSFTAWAIAYGGGRFVAVGYGQIAYSE
jgi:hypothetical protein